MKHIFFTFFVILFTFDSIAQSYNKPISIQLRLFVNVGGKYRDIETIKCIDSFKSDIYYQVNFTNISDSTVSIDSFPQIVDDFRTEGYYFMLRDTEYRDEYEMNYVINTLCSVADEDLHTELSRGQVKIAPGASYTMPYPIHTTFFTHLPVSSWVYLRYRIKIPGTKLYYMQESGKGVKIEVCNRLPRD
jgi:hypothetical protein